MMTDTHTTGQDPQRQAYIAGLRALAALLEDRPDIPLPHTGQTGNSPLNMFGGNTDLIAAMAGLYGRPAAARISDTERVIVWLTWHIQGLAVQVSANATDVCEQHVTSAYRIAGQTREITEWVLPAHLNPTPGTSGRPADEPTQAVAS